MRISVRLLICIATNLCNCGSNKDNATVAYTKRSMGNWISNAFLRFPFKQLMVEKPALRTVDMWKEGSSVLIANATQLPIFSLYFDTEACKRV